MNWKPTKYYPHQMGVFRYLGQTLWIEKKRLAKCISSKFGSGRGSCTSSPPTSETSTSLPPRGSRKNPVGPDPMPVQTDVVGPSGRSLPDEIGNCSLVLFDSGDEIAVQAGEMGIRFLLISRFVEYWNLHLYAGR